MLKEVYIPAMESKKEITHHMNKFIQHIQTSVLQAYGNVTINVPEIPAHMSEKEITSDPVTMQKFQDAVNEWTAAIKESMEQEEKKAKDRVHDTSSGETEFWTTRNAKYNMLYQQLSMNNVKKIIQLIQTNESANDNFSVDTFIQTQKEFQKQHAKAKDFVKFLTTLERQFKNINRGELKLIEDTIFSLLNGLKLIWTISRHINQTDAEFEDILEAISNEICTKVRQKIQVHIIFKQNPQDSIDTIRQGISVLSQWNDLFHKTKMAIEAEITIRRWDFGRIKDIFSKPKHMIAVLENFQTACTMQKEFYAILGNDLKAVTGSSDQINTFTDRVKD
jgi:dynein heavy chain